MVNAAEGEWKDYKDPNYNFVLSYPSDYIYTSQTLADRRVLQLFVSPTSPSTSLFISYTPVRDDYTSLSSFGSVDQVGQMTILPKSELAGSGVESEMISSVSKSDAYFFDYKVKVKDEDKHLRSIFTLCDGINGAAGKVLVTITGQCKEEDYGGVRMVFDKVEESFKKVKG
ncbi:hypothetical protein TrCOL_g5723 [Triparma columacea]|uniref:PsbP C-terminal domain-containing protein n=1 Tax=Triparma columacea TaxID=722753 RepID=A0A9W7G4I5_9STRA|nr:hypothetical protein TrCOL_g5723 [Triparma columacea]